MDSDSSENLQRFVKILNEITDAGFKIEGNKIVLPRNNTSAASVALVEEIAYPNILIDGKGDVDNKCLTDEKYAFLEQHRLELDARKQRLAEAVQTINDITGIDFKVQQGGLLVGKDPLTRQGAVIQGEDQHRVGDFFRSLVGREVESPALDALERFEESSGKRMIVSTKQINPAAQLIMDKFLAFSIASAITFRFGAQIEGDKNGSFLVITDVDPQKLADVELTDRIRNMQPNTSQLPIFPLGK